MNKNEDEVGQITFSQSNNGGTVIHKIRKQRMAGTRL